MGLYLAIFEDDEEIEGVEIGRYSDFNYFRDTVVNELEKGEAGSKFPTLNLHSDCDGLWTPEEAVDLEKELEEIAKVFERLPPIEYNSEWQKDVAKTFGIKPDNLLECFFDVDGEPLLERLIQLAKLSQEQELPILFQ